MIYEIKETAAYKRGYKRMKKRGVDMSELDRVINELKFGRKLAEKYQDHALKGDRAGTRECHIRPDWLLVYTFANDVLVLTLLNTGTHSELLRI